MNVSTDEAGEAGTEVVTEAPVGDDLRAISSAPRRNPMLHRPGGRPWRTILFAPVGDGQTRRRGSDGARAALAVLAVVLCWVIIGANSHSEHSVVRALTSPPDGVRWLVTTVWWAGTVGVIVTLAVVALVSRRWVVIRNTVVAGAGAWLVTVALQALLGITGGRPSDPSLHGIDLSFPIARFAAAIAVVTVALPYLSRWLQLTTEVVLVLAAVAAVVHGSGMPVAVLASLALGWGTTAVVHLVFGSPLGLPSSDEVTALLADLDITASDVAPCTRQEWGVARFTGRIGSDGVDVSVYGRDASDAQILAKTFRFLFYRDSGPTLALTRRQQVEHEAYLTLMAERAGVRAPVVLVAGTAGPANDALLVTRPPAGQLLSSFAPVLAATEAGALADAAARTQAGAAGTGEDAGNGGIGGIGGIGDDALANLFAQVGSLRSGGIAHGSISTQTIVIGGDGTAGLVDFRAASTSANEEQLNRDVAAALAAAARALPADAVTDALPFLQRAALDPVASRTLRGKKTLLNDLRERGASAVGVDVPKLVEPRRISWVNLLMVAGTLIGGWALLGVLVNVTKSWGTIAGADWAWVALVVVLSEAAYPAIAVTTIGSVTNPLPFGRTLALEVSNTFVALAGGSLAVLATRVRFFQKQGYDSTLAVSSGVLVSTASWIVKGGLFLVALPIAIGGMHFTKSPTGGGSHAHLVWLIILIVLAVAVVLGLVFAVPRWRRVAADKLRPKASEMWVHLKVLATHPRNLVEIFGGNILAQVVIALALGAALHAFGDHLGLATLIVVLTLASILGGVSPVPGGMGVVEAGMILGLTASGISQADAVAATFVQRLFTAYLPPIWGWFVMVWLRKKEYL